MSTQPPYRLRVARRRAGLTQRDLAFLFGITPSNYISKLEHGDRMRKPLIPATRSI